MKKTKIAFLFPGQGAQYVGMGKDFYETFSTFRHTLEEANDLLSFDCTKFLFHGSDELLQATQHAQISLFLVCVGIYRVLQKQIPHLIPKVCAGLSLGEYSALFAANKIHFSDVVPIVYKRGLWMKEACETHPGTMSAVIGMEPKVLEEVLHKLNPPHLVWPANYNTPGQIVISGTKHAMELATESLKQHGAKKVIPLKVQGAFHSGLMKTAQEKLALLLAHAPLHESPIDLVMNVPGDYVQEIAQIRNNLILQVTHSVKWQMGIEAMEKHGVDVYLEIGPGHSLTSMNSKIGVKGKSVFVEKVEHLDKVQELLS